MFYANIQEVCCINHNRKNQDTYCEDYSAIFYVYIPDGFILILLHPTFCMPLLLIEQFLI